MKLVEITEVEDYRRKALVKLKLNLPQLKKLASFVLGVNVTIKIIGSILEPKRFNENSDIDIGVYVTPNSKNVDEDLSEKLQEVLISNPIDSLGVINCVVFK